jgi:hypothetical protein
MPRLSRTDYEKGEAGRVGAAGGAQPLLGVLVTHRLMSVEMDQLTAWVPVGTENADVLDTKSVNNRTDSRRQTQEAAVASRCSLEMNEALADEFHESGRRQQMWTTRTRGDVTWDA